MPPAAPVAVFGPRLRDLPQDAQGAALVEGTLGEELVQGTAVQQLHDEVAPAVGERVEVEELDRVGVTELRDDVRLALQA